MSLHEILHLLPETRRNYFPVTDNSDRLVEIFSTDDVRPYLYDEAIWQLAVARGVMTTKLLTVTPDDDLNTALRRFTELNLDELPVVAVLDSGKLIGMLRRKDAIAICNRHLMERKQASLEHA